jgi:hypothetical protein
MADYFPGEIRIGGDIPADLLEELFGELSSTGAKIGGYDGTDFNCQNADELRQALEENGHLFLADDQARFRMFEELEGFLCEHDIPFDRHSDARYEFDAENVRFRPGMERPLEVPSNGTGDDLMDVNKIRPVARELARLAEAKLTHDKLLAAVQEASRKLNEALPPEVEPLPPLQVV